MLPSGETSELTVTRPPLVTINGMVVTLPSGLIQAL
jgi:hypothetical protein